jgi:tRNA dimethylallyltransferase
MRFLAIVGPTASGKSGLAVEIAKRINGTVVNGDPFQAFKCIPIGTGQPGVDERCGIPHAGYGELPLDYVLNPAIFGELVRNWLDAAQKADRTPVLVTGSGLYLRGIWNQLDDLPEVPKRIVEKTRRLCKMLGAPALHSYLRAIDPARAKQLHPNDASRIQRALALHIATGARPNDLLTGVNRVIPPNWQALLVIPQRELLRKRVAGRVKSMISAGWQSEVQQLVRDGFTHHLRRLRPLGYDVWLDEPNPEIAEQKIIRATQAYAKRQVTWFKNQLPDATRIDPDGDIVPNML